MGYATFVVIVRTRNSAYELDDRHHRFRRAGEQEWHSFERASPATVGQPLQLYSRRPGAAPRSFSAFDVWTTSPVVEVIDHRVSADA